MSQSYEAVLPWTEGDDFVAAKLILTCGEDLLVLLRDDFDHIPFPAKWDLPGGGREDGESAVTCALRELREEFGLSLSPDRLDCGTAFRAEGGCAIFFTGRLEPSEIAEIRFGDEGQDWRLMPVAEYVTHPDSVPHFRGRVARCLGVTA